MARRKLSHVAKGTLGKQHCGNPSQFSQTLKASTALGDSRMLTLVTTWPKMGQLVSGRARMRRSLP